MMDLDKFKELVDKEVATRVPTELNARTFPGNTDSIGPYIIVQRERGGCTILRRPTDTAESVDRLYALFLED